ncbi:glycosyltransferase family 4 protein [Acidobacteria bacterium AB60]|nr:glycosyltransferase family 4 protein [Acidobacteria bacterium AB60]
MRVLMTTDTVGGVWTFTQELAAGLLESGCTVSLVSFGRLPSPVQQDDCQRLAGMHRERFFYRPSEIGLEWMEDNQTVYEEGASLLTREAVRFSPDVIHSNQFCYGALQLAIPCVVSAHSDVFSWFRACRGASPPPSHWLATYRETVQAGLLQCSAVIAPTRWMMRELAQAFELPQRCDVISNGRTVEAGSGSPRKMCAVTVGRLWDEAKGIDTLHTLRSPIPILVAGSTTHPDARRPPSIASATYLGELGGDQILHLFQSSSIYLCLSRYEPFGLAPLEAALCGCAVVARDLPSLREVWGDSALYFEDTRSLQEILSALAAAPELLAAARESAHRRALAFDRAQMTRHYLDLFESTVAPSERAEHAA